MAHSELCIYSGNHVIPIHQRNGYSEDRDLSINILDFGDKVQIKLKDLAEYSFNYSEYVDLGDFEVIRLNQSLDINFSEFKTNIVDMLHQFHRKEMLLKCQLTEKNCTLVFFTKSKIKSIVYLTLDLRMTDQKEIIAEMYTEMHELQNVNTRLQKQLSKAKKIVHDKELEIHDLDIARQLVLNEFCKNIHQIETLFTSKLTQIQSQVSNKVTTLKNKLLELHQKIEILKQENNLKVDSSDRLIKTMENLRLENIDNSETIQDLKKENSSLNILRVTLERNIADLKKSLEDVQSINRNMEKKKVELERDLEKLSIIVTQKDSKISELSKDLVQANNMLVQFNNHFDTKVHQVEELQDALSVKERLLLEQKGQTNQILKSFEEYKMSFNTEKFENVKKDLLMSNKRIHELEEEVRKLNKNFSMDSEVAGREPGKGNATGTATLSTCTTYPSTSRASSASALLLPSTSSTTSTISNINKKKRKRIENASSSGSKSIASFVVKTSEKLKHDLDKQIAKAVYQTNSSFRCLQKSEVLKAIQMLRPGYIPPTPYAIGNPLLEEIYKEEKHECFKNLANACVCMSIDGWSNIHNEPVVCATVTTETGDVYLYETIDTSGHPHTADYLSKIVGDLISSCANEYNCTVTSFVTDNAANMNKMREELRRKDDVGFSIITYGCSAHLMNLLAQDLEVRDVKGHIVQIIKYFRNNHFANAKCKQEGCRVLVLPSDVRWNTMADCLEVYLNEWPKLVKICEESKDKIDSIIYGKIMNMIIKRAAEDYLKMLKPVAVALDKLQGNVTTISDAVEIWKGLGDKLELAEVSLNNIQLFQKRYKTALTPAHFLAFIIDPRKRKYSLTSEETSAALEFANEMYLDTGFLPLVIKCQNKSLPFRSLMYSDEITSNISPIEWWLSHKDVFGKNEDVIIKIAKQLLGAVASSASVERMFSSFGLVHSKLRNRLGVEKAGKLVFLFKHYNSKCNILFDD